MKVGVDFDRVLFRTQEFKEYLEQKFPGFLEEYPEEGVYDHEVHAEKLGISSERLIAALEDARDFVYEDFKALRELQDKHKLILVSRGDPSFQTKKIANSGVSSVFDAVVVLRNGPKDLFDIDFLVDDQGFEHQKVEIPGLEFDRSKHSAEDIVKEVRANETGGSV